MKVACSLSLYQCHELLISDRFEYDEAEGTNPRGAVQCHVVRADDYGAEGHSGLERELSTSMARRMKQIMTVGQLWRVTGTI